LIGRAPDHALQRTGQLLPKKIQQTLVGFCIDTAKSDVIAVDCPLQHYGKNNKGIFILSQVVNNLGPIRYSISDTRRIAC